MRMPETQVERLLERASEFGLTIKLYQAAGGWLVSGPTYWQIELAKWVVLNAPNASQMTSADFGTWRQGGDNWDNTPRRKLEARRLYGRSLFIQLGG